jgi:hypothetical protein
LGPRRHGASADSDCHGHQRRPAGHGVTVTTSRTVLRIGQICQCTQIIPHPGPPVVPHPTRRAAALASWGNPEVCSGDSTLSSPGARGRPGPKVTRCHSHRMVTDLQRAGVAFCGSAQSGSVRRRVAAEACRPGPLASATRQ